MLLNYLSRGWQPIPIPSRAKSPVISNWPAFRVTPETAPHHFPDGCNVGILLGAPSGIVDIDLDDAKAAELAPKYLPPTASVFGRASKPRSHWIYRVKNPQPTRRHQSKTDRRTIVEYRSNGAQTVFPPSVHPSGEVIAWAQDGEPAEVDGQVLAEAAERLAEAVRSSGNLNFDASTILPAPGPSPFDRCRAYLEKCPEAVSGQGGHNATFLAACECYRFGLSPDEAWAMLDWWNSAKCDPPWNEKELRHKWLAAEKRVREDNELGTRLTGKTADYTGMPCVAVAEPRESEGPPPKIDPFPAYLLEPPGFVGDLCNWINSTAYKPQPILALANALAFCGALFGRKVASPSNLRTNLYCLGIGASGCGKDHARQAIKLLCDDANAMHLLGGEDVSSDSAIISALRAQPSLLFQFDEFGHMMRNFSGKNASAYARSVPQVLMKLFSSAGSVYLGKQYANANERPREDIQQPNACIYGTTVPERFFDSLTRDEVLDGFLGRLLVFISDDPDPDKMSVQCRRVPESIVNFVSRWVNFRTQNPSGGDIERATKNVPITVPLHDDAVQIFDDFYEECRRRKQAERSGAGMDALWARAEEHATKVALVLAAGTDSWHPNIDGCCALNAVQLITHLIQRFTASAADYIASSEYERNLKRIMRIITDAGEDGVSKNILSSKMQHLDIRSRDAIILDLLSQSRIEKLEYKTKTRTGTKYRQYPQNGQIGDSSDKTQ